MYMTPMILNRSWKLTSLIRNPDHESDIRSTYSGSNSNNLNFLISSLEDVKSTEDASKILNTVKPDYVVWSAGSSISYLPVTSLMTIKTVECFENMNENLNC